MDKTINITKTVINKEAINRLNSREITFFVNEPSSTDTITVDEFFQAYDTLYFEIPIEGPLNSHEYLVRKSSELYSIDQDVSNLQPLLDEIAQLRSRLLLANNTISELENRINS
jgi:hypothetical protein